MYIEEGESGSIAIDYRRYIHHLFNNVPHHHRNHCIYRPLLRHSEFIFKIFLSYALEIKDIKTNKIKSNTNISFKSPDMSITRMK